MADNIKIRIGTRGSKLALTQSEWVKAQICNRHPGAEVSLVKIKTKGDKILDSPLSKIGGKGLFVKEIEEALIRNEVDVAVHSMKDVPAELPDGLKILVYPVREDPRDAFVSIDFKSIKDLPEGASIGTGSLRRSAQLLAIRPDLNIVSIRGNVDTRLKKLESGDLQGIILAAAGLRRLGLKDRITEYLPGDHLLPAIGQGALGLEMRINDERVRNALGFLNHDDTEMTVRAERAFLEKLEGGCQVPIAGHGVLEGDVIVLQGMVAELDGSRVLKDEIRGSRDNPEKIGTDLADKLLKEGAGRILEEVYGSK